METLVIIYIEDIVKNKKQGSGFNSQFITKEYEADTQVFLCGWHRVAYIQIKHHRIAKFGSSIEFENLTIWRLTLILSVENRHLE